MRQLFQLLKGLKNHKKAALLGPFFILASVAMELMLPAIMQRMIDIGVASQDMAYIVRMGLVMLVFSLLSMGAGLVANYFASVASQGLGGDIRRQVFEKIMYLSQGNVDRLQSGQLITRATNDVNQVQMTAMMSLKIALRAPIMLVGGLVMVWLTAPSLTWLITIMIPLLVVGLAFIIRYAFPMFSKVQSRIDGVNTVFGENLSGIRVIKAFVRDAFEKSRFKKVNEALFETSVAAYERIALMMPLIMLVTNLGIVGVLYVGGFQFGAGTIQIGQIQAFINYLEIIMFSLIMLAMVMMMISRAEASSVRIMEVFNEETDVRDKEGALVLEDMKGRVEFDHVYFNYDGTDEDCVLKDISFTALPGQTVAILGSTGSGKSSLIHLIPRFYDVCGGRVLIDGVDVRQMTQASLRDQVGVALQTPLLFAGSIKDNLAFAREGATDEEIVQVSKMAQAHDFVEKMDEGYESMLSQRAVNLSGGQKQRLSIARALISDPAILILDDSTSAVDVETETRIQKALEGGQKKRTTFVIAQRISTVLEADKIIVLDDGMIKAVGDHDHLMEVSPIYQDIYRSQLGGIGHD